MAIEQNRDITFSTFQLQTHPRADISLAGLLKRRVYEHHSHEQAPAQVLHGQLRSLRQDTHGTA